MKLLNRLRHEADQALDPQAELTTLDKLTQQAAVALSRRGFLKKLGVGTAVAGIGMVATTQTALAQVLPAACYKITNTRCPTSYTCVSCSGSRQQTKRTTYDEYQCGADYVCLATSTVYGTCGSCPS